MTSTNDGKDVKSNQTSGPKGKTYYIELYKSIEARLCEGGTASERTKHLCEAWGKVHSLCQHSAPSTHTHLLAWLQRHTARAVLQAAWQKPERKGDRKCLEEAIDEFIAQCETAAASRADGLTSWEEHLVARGVWFKRVIERPWDHPVLTLLLNPDGSPPTDEEVVEWLKEERGVTFAMRLYTLVRERCEDIAASLAAAVMERVRAAWPPVCDHEPQGAPETPAAVKTEPTFGDRLRDEAGFSTDVIELVTDIEFVLLHKCDSKRCIALAKRTPMLGAHHVIERLQMRLDSSPREKRLWKNAKEVAVLIAQVVIARCMMVSVCTGRARTALYCCARLLAQLLAARLPSAAAALATQAPTAAHLHTLAHAVDKQLSTSNEMKPYICELYVRAITAGMNELERLKLKTEKEAEARMMEKTLALWFVQLGAVLALRDRLQSECTLTAFSLHPSLHMYERLNRAPLLAPLADADESKEDAVKSEFGSWANDSRSQTNFVKTSETLNMKQTQNQANVLSTAIFTEGEALGLSPELCQDIAVLLSGPRIKTLSWDMDRTLLLENCRAYMERTGGGTRGLARELKFLDLNQYQHLPEERDDDENDPYYGIERGYEHLAIPEYPDDDMWDDPDRTESASSSFFEDDFIVPRRKKKTKKLLLSSDEDSDPLSFMAEAKRVQKKKERPHSKERSKERTKKKQEDDLYDGDPLRIEPLPLNVKEKPKEKKERKKKEKIPKQKLQKSLSDLVGVKVVKSKKNVTTTKAIASVTDSDYDSQGKCSLASLNSEGNEHIPLYDGLLSRDELKTAERKSSLPSVGHPEIVKKKQYFGGGGGGNGNLPTSSSSTSFDRNPNNINRMSYRPLTPNYKDDVRASITKLLEFRRQKSAIELKTNPPNNTAPPPPRRPAIIRPDLRIQTNVTPKAVAIPEIPKSYIKKEHAEKLAQLKKEVDSLVAETRKDKTKSSVIQFARKNDIHKSRSKSFQSQSGAQQPNAHSLKMSDIVNVPYDRLMAEITERQGRVIGQSVKPPHSQYQPSQPHTSLNVMSAGQKDYQNFLKEYDNTKYMPCTSARALDMSKNIKKDVKPVSRLEPVLPQCTITKVDLKAQPCAKLQTQQKKPEVSLNTFSRLSYMHKNKQNEIKNKSSQEKPLYSHSTYQEVSSELDAIIKEHKRARMQIMQDKNERLLVKTQNINAQEFMKDETCTAKSGSHPVLSNLLHNPPTSIPGTSTCRNSSQLKSCLMQQKLCSPPKTSLSERDQRDLLQLLRQQNKMNAPQHQSTNMSLNPSTSSNNVSTTSLTNDIKSMSCLNQEEHNKPATHAICPKLYDSKLINIISNSIIKPAHEGVDEYESSLNPKSNTKAATKNVKTSDNQEKVKKPAANKVHSRKISGKPSPESEKSEWQAVMSDILKHKTPLRGPNALDVALNKSSFEQAFENSLKTTANAPRLAISEDIFEHDTLYEKSVLPSSSTSTHNVIISTNQDEKTQSDIPNQQKASSKIKKKSDVSMVDKLIKPKPELTKKLPYEVQRKQFTYAGPKHDDPFISGIPNSDYDLLEELMDDDLRKEIGELSSDDESYNVAAQTFLKPTKGNEKRVSVEFNKPLNDAANKRMRDVPYFNQSTGNTMAPTTQKPVICANNIASMTLGNNSSKMSQKVATNKIQDDIRPITSTIERVPAHIHIAPRPHKAYNNAQTVINSQATINPDIYISGVHQPAPLQNVVLIGSELVYEGYSTLQTPAQTSNTYVAVNNVPNLALYQTTPLSTPAVNPLIIGNSLTLPIVNNISCSIPVQSCAINNVAQTTYPEKPIGAQAPVPDPHVIEKGSYDINNETYVPVSVAVSPLPNNRLIDVNKIVERKVLSEVQELAVIEKIDKVRSQIIEIKNDASADQDRLKSKRLAIINREIYHRCRDETIPLSYSPLPLKTLMVPKEHDFTKAIPLEYVSLNSNEDKQKISDCEEDKLLLAQIKNDLQDLSNAINEVKSPATPDSIESKENKSHTTVPCRRILLRSSNKITSKTNVVCSASESSTNKKSKVKLKSALIEVAAKVDDKSSLNSSGKQSANTEKRASKRLRNKTLTVTKEEKMPLQRQRQKPTPKHKLPAKTKTSKLEANIEQPTMRSRSISEAKFVDIEAELLGSKIPKTFIENKEKQQINSNISQGDIINKGLPAAGGVELLEKTENTSEHITIMSVQTAVNIDDNAISEKLNHVLRNVTNEESEINSEKEAKNGNVTTGDASDKPTPKKEADNKIDEVTDDGLDKPKSVNTLGTAKKIAKTDVKEATDENVDKPESEKYYNMLEKTTKNNFKEVTEEIFDTAASEIIESVLQKDESMKINEATEKIDKEVDKIVHNEVKEKADNYSVNFMNNNESKPSSDNRDSNLIHSVSVKEPDGISSKAAAVELTVKCNPSEGIKNINTSVNDSHTDNFKEKENVDLDMTVTCEETNLPKKSSGFVNIKIARNKNVGVQHVNENTASNSVTKDNTEAPKSSYIQSSEITEDDIEVFEVLPVSTSQNILINQQIGPQEIRETHLETSAIPNSSTKSIDDIDDDDVVVIEDDSITTSNASLFIPNNSTQNTIDTEVTSGVANSLLDGINIENLPSSEPMKKSVRVTLPNGRKFKLTVTGEMHVTLDTLFTYPTIKEALLNGLSCRKYTMNVQQITTVEKNDRSKIISALIKNTDVSTALSSEPVETIDLLSDDEDNNPPKVNDTSSQIFITEYGKYKIVPIDKDVFTKHQKKLNQKSLILLKKVDEKPDNQLKRPCSDKIINNEIFKAIPNKYVKGIINDIENKLTTTAKNSSTNEVVEIDDSSNDSLDNVISFGKNDINKPDEKINKLKNELLKELGVEAKKLRPKNKKQANIKIKKGSILEKIDLTKDRHQPSEMSNLSITSKEEKSPLYNLTKEEQFKITNRKCQIKLVRCDDLSKIFEKEDRIASNNLRLKVPDGPPLIITGDFSILNDIDKSIVGVEARSSSPVIEPPNLLITLHNRTQQIISLSCNANWFTTKSKIHREAINDVIMTRPYIFENYNNDTDVGINSTNVYKETETLSLDSLDHAYPMHYKSPENQVIPLSCESNWFSTKYMIHLQDVKNAVLVRNNVIEQGKVDTDNEATSMVTEMSTEARASAELDNVDTDSENGATCLVNEMTTKAQTSAELYSVDIDGENGSTSIINEMTSDGQPSPEMDNVDTESENGATCLVNEMTTDAQPSTELDNIDTDSENGSTSIVNEMTTDAQPSAIINNVDTDSENNATGMVTEMTTEARASAELDNVDTDSENGATCLVNEMTTKAQTSAELYNVDIDGGNGSTSIINEMTSDGQPSPEMDNVDTDSENSATCLVNEMTTDAQPSTDLDNIGTDSENGSTSIVNEMTTDAKPSAIIDNVDTDSENNATGMVNEMTTEAQPSAELYNVDIDGENGCTSIDNEMTSDGQPSPEMDNVDTESENGATCLVNEMTTDAQPSTELDNIDTDSENGSTSIINEMTSDGQPSPEMANVNTDIDDIENGATCLVNERTTKAQASAELYSVDIDGENGSTSIINEMTSDGQPSPEMDNVDTESENGATCLVNEMTTDAQPSTELDNIDTDSENGSTSIINEMTSDGQPSPEKDNVDTDSENGATCQVNEMTTDAQPSTELDNIDTDSENDATSMVNEMTTDAQPFAELDNVDIDSENDATGIVNKLTSAAQPSAEIDNVDTNSENVATGMVIEMTSDAQPSAEQDNVDTDSDNINTGTINEMAILPLPIQSQSAVHLVTPLSCDANWFSTKFTLHSRDRNNPVLVPLDSLKQQDNSADDKSPTTDVIIEALDSSDDKYLLPIEAVGHQKSLSRESNCFSSLPMLDLNYAVKLSRPDVFEEFYKNENSETVTINTDSEIPTKAEPLTYLDNSSHIHREFVTHLVIPLWCNANWFTTKAALHSRNWNTVPDIYEQNIESSCIKSVTTSVVCDLTKNAEPSTSFDDPSFKRTEAAVRQLIPLSCEANWFTSKSMLHLQEVNNATLALPKVLFQSNEEKLSESSASSSLYEISTEMEEEPPQTNCAPSLMSLVVKYFQNANIIDQLMTIRNATIYFPVNSLKRKSSSPATLTACKVSKLDSEIKPEINDCSITYCLTLKSPASEKTSALLSIENPKTSDLEESPVYESINTKVSVNELDNKNGEENARTECSTTILCGVNYNFKVDSIDEDKVFKIDIGQNCDDNQLNTININCDSQSGDFEAETVHNTAIESELGNNIGSANDVCDDYQAPTINMNKEVDIKNDIESRSPSPVIEIGHILSNDIQYTGYGAIRHKSVDTEDIISPDNDNIYDCCTPSPLIQIEIMRKNNEINMLPSSNSNMLQLESLQPGPSSSLNTDDISSSAYQSEDISNSSPETDMGVSWTQNVSTHALETKVNEYTIADDLDDIELRLAEIVGQSLVDDSTGKQCNKNYNLDIKSEETNDHASLKLENRKNQMESGNKNIKCSINEEKQSVCVTAQDSKTLKKCSPKKVFTFADHEYTNSLATLSECNIVNSEENFEHSSVSIHNGIFLSEDETTEDLEEEIVEMDADENIVDISFYSQTSFNNDAKDSSACAWTTLDKKIPSICHVVSNSIGNVNKPDESEVKEKENKHLDTTDILVEECGISYDNNEEKGILSSEGLSAETILRKYLSLIGNNSEVLEGIVEYEDPKIGTCYVIPVIKKSSESDIVSDEETEVASAIVKDLSINKIQKDDDETILPLMKNTPHDFPVNYDDIESRLAQIVGEPLLNADSETQTKQNDRREVNLDEKYKTLYSVEVESVSETKLKNLDAHREDVPCQRKKSNDHLKLQNRSKAFKKSNGKESISNKCKKKRSDYYEKSKDNLNSDVHTEHLIVMRPKHTYAREDGHKGQRWKSLKRKLDMSDIKFKAKKYRKSKNIDCPKMTRAFIFDTAYAKEYKCLFDYCSSVKFSYAIPFHKEDIDVHNVLKAWPIKNNCPVTTDDPKEENETLFTEIEQSEPVIDPMEQTLTEEITSEYNESSYKSSNIDESNFSMGFGEGSGRVIQKLKDGEYTTFSAATLSDVKQLQPLLPSDEKEALEKPICNISNEYHDQRVKVKQFMDNLNLRQKVRSFFEKTKTELFLEQKVNNMKKDNKKLHAAANWAIDYASPIFFQPPPVEIIVNVVQVQVGQPPVSAAVQNPVTCDPRVTHVSNVSPSQCLPENTSGDDLQTTIKTEYTELTTADITLPLMQEYAQHHHSVPAPPQEPVNLYGTGDKISICTELKSIVKIELMEETSQDNTNENVAYENNALQELPNGNINNGGQYQYKNLANNTTNENDFNTQAVANSYKKSKSSVSFSKDKHHTLDKSDQLVNAMSAAGISAGQCITKRKSTASSQNAQSDVVTTSQATGINYTKSTPINALALQQALAQILPPPLTQTDTSENNQQTATNPPALHIVQGNHTQSVINKTNGAPLLHIVQNKSGATNGIPASQGNSYGGLSLVDGAIQQNGNQLLQIVNTGNHKNSNAGQLLKRVNLLTNLANVQGSNDQKMVQFVCKSADGKSIQLPHQRSMVLRLQQMDQSSKQNEAQDLSQSSSTQSTHPVNDKESPSQEMKSRSLYEENYAKFVQNSDSKSGKEKATSLPKFNQAFGKQIYLDKQSETNSENLPENSECPQGENNIQMQQIPDIGEPPPLVRKPQNLAQASQSQSTLVQQIKQSIGPMNIQTMHGGVIYTRQIPVNLGNGQTINLITVPSTELVDDTVQKQQTDSKLGNQEGEHSIIKIVPTSQSPMAQNEESTNEANAQPQSQPLLTQMRIKLPMLSKAPQMVGGTRVVRPSFFQIQRNVIGGANQQVYQQLVLTAAPSLSQSIRVPAQTPKLKSETQSSSESQMSSSTLEQLREFDMVLEQVKERSTVQPGSSTSKSNNVTKSKPSADTTDAATPSKSTPTPVLYSVGNTQPLNMVNFVNRKSTITSTTTSSFVRSPDSTGIVESPSSSTHTHLTHTVRSSPCASSCASEASATTIVPKPKKKKPKPSTSNSNPFNIKNTPKPSSQKPLEDEQTTQRILYILAEYKEQVENSPDKDKPAPRRRNNPGAPNPGGSSKRKKSSSGSRRRDNMSPVVGEDSCRTMGSEDSSCGTSMGECNECVELESQSPEESPRKVVRRLTFEQETHITTQTRTTTTTIPQRNLIVTDGQAFSVRGATGKPATTVLMPANYLLPVSMVKGGQQIAIVTNRGPKLLVGAGEGGTGGTLLLQRLIGPGGLKPMLARPGVRHIRLPTAALHNLQAFNIGTPASTVQPPDSTASPAPAPNPPDLVDTRAMSSPWPDREAGESKPERGNASPDGSEPWNLPSSSIADDYGYEEIVRTDNMDRTVLDAIPDRYSPDMEAQRIFDKMFDVDSKKSMYDSRGGYDIDASDDDKAYHQVVQRKDGRQTRLTHVSAAALRHKYAILEHELRLQKSLSEECEDLGVDSPSASDLFPEAELLFAPSPAHEQTIDQCHTPQPSFLHGIPQPDLDDQIATDHLLTRSDRNDELDINLDDVGEIVTVGDDGMTTIPLDHDEFARSHEEFARSHPNTTFHSEPEDGEIPPFTIAQGMKGRQVTFHTRGGPGTVVMAPQTTVISQATVEATGSQNTVKFTDIDNMINSMQSPHSNIPSVLVKDHSEGLSKFDRLLNESKQHSNTSNTASVVHSTGNGTQVIRRVSYETRRDSRFDPDAVTSDKNERRNIRSFDNASPERQERFWDAPARPERRRFDFSDKCKSPFANSDSSGVAVQRLDSVIKAARTERRRSDGSSADDSHPPLRTYPAKRSHHPHPHSHPPSEPERPAGGRGRGERCQETKDEGRRRASNRGVVKRSCHCGNGSAAPPKPKKSRAKKSTDYPPH